MKLLEKLNRLFILTLAYFRFKTAKEKGNNALIFCNNMGIGNFIEYLPTLKILIEKHQCDIITNNPEIKWLCREVLGKGVFDKPYFSHYDYVYCNFLNQTKANIKEIIQLNIPNRIGHDYKPQNKWAGIFNLTFPCDDNDNETEFNLMLALRFYFDGKFEHKFNNKKGDYIAIQCGATVDREREYPHMGLLIRALTERNKVILVGTYEERNRYNHLVPAEDVTFEETCHQIQSARLYIGCDAGLTHVAWMCKTPSIVIWNKTESLNRCMHEESINLYRPTVKTILKIADGLLN